MPESFIASKYALEVVRFLKSNAISLYSRGRIILPSAIIRSLPTEVVINLAIASASISRASSAFTVMLRTLFPSFLFATAYHSSTFWDFTSSLFFLLAYIGVYSGWSSSFFSIILLNRAFVVSTIPLWLLKFVCRLYSSPPFSFTIVRISSNASMSAPLNE